MAILLFACLFFPSRVFALLPRSSDRGLIEATDRPQSHSQADRALRDHQIAASLKLNQACPGYDRNVSLRDHQIAASLKQLRDARTLVLLHGSPRSSDRGLIEAFFDDPEVKQALPLRDHQIAASLKPRDCYSARF